MRNREDGRQPLERIQQAQSIVRICEQFLWEAGQDSGDWADELRFTMGAVRCLLEDVGDDILDAEEERRKEAKVSK